MTKVGYGFVGGKQNIGLNNLFDSLKSKTFNARVIDIILDESHPRFREAGEWNGLGTIIFNNTDDVIRDGLNYPLARPLFPNIKIYPLKNELVYCIRLANSDINENTGQRKIYYFPPISIWNHPHHNALPNILNGENLPENSKQDYPLIEAGNVRRVSDNSTDIDLGKTFKERSNIHPLLPFEGDIILEGRWGNSIRFGSTVKNTLNNWSMSGLNGDPITILRNGQGSDEEIGWIPTTENINIDNSSIYLTSTQNVPLNVSSTNNYKSYTTLPDNPPPTKPFDYHGKQILINSGRLVFNTNQDHLLLSSKKSINLNAVKSINFDTSGPIVLSTSTWTSKIGGIYLGSPEIGKTEPAVMGEQMYELIFSLLEDLKVLFDTIEKELCNPFPITADNAFKAANNINVLLDKYKKDDQNNSLLLSQTVRTAK